MKRKDMSIKAGLKKANNCLYFYLSVSKAHVSCYADIFALSLPCSSHIKAFKYLNSQVNELFQGKPSRRFHFLEAEVVFILFILAGFSIFWTQATHHGFVFGYSQHSGDGIFGGGKLFFLSQMQLFFKSLIFSILRFLFNII